MLTRCPQCETTFRVTPEQLKARLGKVRCGECGKVFNALDTLIDETPPPAFEAPPQAFSSGVATSSVLPEEPAESEDASFSAPEAPIEVAQHRFPHEETPPPADSDPEPQIEPEAVTEPAASPAAIEDQPSSSLELVTAPEPEPLPKPEPARETAAANEPFVEDWATVPPTTPPENATAAPPEPNRGDAATDPEPSLSDPPLSVDAEPSVKPEPAGASPLPVAPPPAAVVPSYHPELHEPPAPPRRAWPWALGAAAGLLLLLAQLAIGLRTEVAILYPQAKPLLAALCEFAGCQLSLPRKVDQVGIESSDLHPGTGNGKLLLVASLRNRAPFAQEYPHLELTLTDAADAPLARRVIPPADYLPARLQGSEGFAANTDLPLNLSIAVDRLAAAGYRLYLFYP